MSSAYVLTKIQSVVSASAYLTQLALPGVVNGGPIGYTGQVVQGVHARSQVGVAQRFSRWLLEWSGKVNVLGDATEKW